MEYTNFPQEVIKRINPLGKITEKSIQRVTPFYTTLPNEPPMCTRIINQTGNINLILFGIDGGRMQKELKVDQMKSKLILANFNRFVLELGVYPRKNQNYFGYFASNPGVEDSPFLGVGLSLEDKYYGLQFLFVDDNTCRIKEITNSSLEKIINLH